jgi:cyanate permease
MVMRCFGPVSFGRVMGLLTPFFIPAAFAPILFGWIRDETGGYRLGFLVFAAWAVPGAVCLLLMRTGDNTALAPTQGRPTGPA